MTAETRFVTRYERRVQLVQDIVQEHTKLGAKDANKLAAKVLAKLDKDPETLR